MRILVINYEYPPIGGGGGFVTRDILEHIAHLGHHVTVITSHYDGLSSHESFNGVDIIRVPVFFRNKLEVANMPSMLCYPPMAVIRGLSRALSNKYDIVNTHFAVPSGPAGFILSKLAGIPNVLTIHGGDIFDPSKKTSPHKSPVFSYVVRFMLKSADRVVAQSSDTKANALKYYRVHRHIDIIPLGIKKPLFQRKARHLFHLDSNEMVFCTIGRLVKRKNIDDILFVLAELKENFPFKFIIIGNGPERKHLEKLARNLGLTGKVKLPGNVTDEVKFQLLDISDVYLSTAIHEGFGLVFLEAMECGLPVLCYNRGGQKDFLINGKTGFLVDLGDKEGLKAKLLSLVNNDHLRREIAAFNKDYVKRFYIDRCGDRYLSLFHDTLTRNGKKVNQSNEYPQMGSRQ